MLRHAAASRKTLSKLVVQLPGSAIRVRCVLLKAVPLAAANQERDLVRNEPGGDRAAWLHGSPTGQADAASETTVWLILASALFLLLVHSVSLSVSL